MLIKIPLCIPFFFFWLCSCEDWSREAAGGRGPGGGHGGGEGPAREGGAPLRAAEPARQPVSASAAAAPAAAPVAEDAAAAAAVDAPAPAVDYEALAQELQGASPLEIMDRALAMFGSDIAIAFRYYITRCRMDPYPLIAPVNPLGSRCTGARRFLAERLIPLVLQRHGIFRNPTGGPEDS